MHLTLTLAEELAAMHTTYTRYRRLIQAMQWVAILSPGEAVMCLRDYRAGTYNSSAAVVSFGGPLAVIRAAIRVRDRVHSSGGLRPYCSSCSY